MLKIHSLPDSEKKSGLFGVSVNGISVVPEFARVSAMPFNTPWPGHQRDLSQTEESAFVSFESDEKVCVDVKASVDIKTAVLRPLSKNVKIDILSDNSLRFELTQVGHYVLEINGMHSPLTIFFNPVRDFEAEVKKDAASGRKVFYYGAGVYETGDIEVPSHSTVCIDAGAIVYGSISAFDAEDVKIIGYGVLDGSREIRSINTRLLPVMHGFDTEYPYFAKNRQSFDEFMNKTACLKGLLRFYFCKNISCEGVILRDSSTFCVIPAICEDIVIDNLKTIGMWRYNSDGIDVFNSRDIVIKNCFIRNFDDAIVIKGISGWDYMNNENITVDNCVIWCDWGAACEIGAETNAAEFKNFTYKNCDILYDVAGAMMRIHHHNRADIHHISYENMHCEFRRDQMNVAMQGNDDEVYEYKQGTYQPHILELVIPETVVYGRDALKGSIHDVSFKNIHLHIEDGVTLMPQIRFKGLDEKCCVKDVSLEDFYLNGKKVDIEGELDTVILDYAYNISFD